jgi:hypothetical protein
MSGISSDFRFPISDFDRQPIATAAHCATWHNVALDAML